MVMNRVKSYMELEMGISIKRRQWFPIYYCLGDWVPFSFSQIEYKYAMRNLNKHSFEYLLEGFYISFQTIILILFFFPSF